MRQRNYLAAAALIVTFVTVTPHLNAQERSRTATDNKEPAAIDTLKRMERIFVLSSRFELKQTSQHRTCSTTVSESITQTSSTSSPLTTVFGSIQGVTGKSECFSMTENRSRSGRNA